MRSPTTFATLLILCGSIWAQNQSHQISLVIHHSTIEKALDAATSWPFSAVSVSSSVAGSRKLVLVNETKVVVTLAIESIRQVEEFISRIAEGSDADEWNKEFSAFLAARPFDNTKEKEFADAGGSALETMLFRRDENMAMTIASRALTEYVLANPLRVSEESRNDAKKTRNSPTDAATFASLWMHANRDLKGQFAAVRAWVSTRTKRHIAVRLVAIEWLEHQVTHRPEIALGNPLSIAALRVNSSCRVRIDYSWRGIEGGHTQHAFLSCHNHRQSTGAEFNLATADKTKVVLTPSVKKLNLSLRSMGKDFRCLATEATNELLAADPYTVLDLKSLTLPLVDVRLQLAIKNLKVETSPKQVKLDIEMQ